MVRSQPTEDFDPGSFLEHNRFRNSFRVQALMETIECHWNSVLSTKGAKHCTGDISNMHLGSDLPEAECARFKLSLIFCFFYKQPDITTECR